MKRSDSTSITEVELSLWSMRIASATDWLIYGYRKIAELLRNTGWVVNDKRVERIWRREGLKVPAKQTKRGRLWLADGSCVRLRAERPNHVWSYDFVEDYTHEGRKYRMLNIVDEFSHECPFSDTGRSSPEAYNALTFAMDPSLGADHDPATPARRPAAAWRRFPQVYGASYPSQNPPQWLKSHNSWRITFQGADQRAPVAIGDHLLQTPPWW
jgi:hypothetical protein